MTTDKTTKNVSPYAWVILLLVFFSSMAAPLHMYKVPPVMDLVMQHFGITFAEAGWLMSIFAVIGAVLALPSGFIIGRIGIKNAGLAAMGCLIAGSIAGAFAPNIWVLLASRIVEGTGMCLMSIVAPAALAAWFPPDKRGLAMGIWGTWVPLGSIVAFNAAPWCAEKFGWSGIWWLCITYTVAVSICFAIFFRMPPVKNSAQKTQTIPAKTFSREWEKMRQVLAVPDPWRLAWSFAAYMMLCIPLTTYMPFFLQQERQFSPDYAAFLATGMLVANMAGVPAGGILSDAIKSRKKYLVFPYVALAVCMAFFYLPGNGLIWTMIAVGFIGGLAVTATFSAAPELVGTPEETGAVLAVLALGQNIGMCAGPALYGTLAQHLGWEVAGYATIPILLSGAWAAWKMRVR